MQPATTDRRRRPDILLGGALLAAMVAAATLGAALWPIPPNRTLDPAVSALAAPGTRFETVLLADGRRLAADAIERRDGSYLLRAGDGERRIDPRQVIAAAQSQRFWLGSDRFGRDVVARLLHGGRISLAVAAAAVLLALGIGVPFGLAAGLARGGAATLMLALLDAAQAFPRLFLVVALAAVAPPRPTTTVWILAATGWMTVARLVRSEARRLAASDFVLAARAAGAGPARVALRHVLPNVFAPVGIEASLGMAGAVSGEAALSFLGLGAPPPAASWGSLIAEGRDLLADAAWISLAPGIALVLTVLACNLIAEGLRDRLDPRCATLAL